MNSAGCEALSGRHLPASVDTCLESDRFREIHHPVSTASSSAVVTVTRGQARRMRRIPGRVAYVVWHLVCVAGTRAVQILAGGDPEVRGGGVEVRPLGGGGRGSS